MPLVGDRAAIEGGRLTVRFFGALNGKDGIWVGVEWDDPSRGKHDGSLDGQQYFSCCGSGPCGSFLKLEKYQQLASQGCSLGEALFERYSDTVRDEAVAVGRSSRTILTASEKPLAVQLLEHQKVQARQADLQRLERASLPAAGVAHVVRHLILPSAAAMPAS